MRISSMRSSAMVSKFTTKGWLEYVFGRISMPQFDDSNTQIDEFGVLWIDPLRH
jgi:hypothetical protein